MTNRGCGFLSLIANEILLNEDDIAKLVGVKTGTVKKWFSGDAAPSRPCQKILHAAYIRFLQSRRVINIAVYKDRLDVLAVAYRDSKSKDLVICDGNGFTSIKDIECRGGKILTNCQWLWEKNGGRTNAI